MKTARPGTDRRPGGRAGLTYEQRVLFMGVLTGLPGAAVAFALLWLGDYSARVQWTLGLLVGIGWWAMVLALRERVIRPLQTLSNMLAALLEGDYSFRSRSSGTNDALGLAMREVNALGATLREQRLGALEATALLRKVMAEIEVAVFAFDAEQRLRLVNRAGQRLLGRPAERLVGYSAGELGLLDCLSQGAAAAPQIVDAAFPGRAGRWEVRTSEFRQGGMPHRLLVLTDLSRALRDEERQAWKRIIRVLGHEINNSLAPIQSIAASLRSRLDREPRPAELREDVDRGLSVIATRAEALGRFMGAYARLARLPPPRPEPVDVGAWVGRVAQLETRRPVRIVAGEALEIQADADQLEQALINLVRNAVDAVLETGGAVEVRWHEEGGRVDVVVEDEGPGLADTTNLFVPFFTTKPGGTGIGLVLAREIAEAHGGALTLANRTDRSGCRARLRLPIARRPAPAGDSAPA